MHASRSRILRRGSQGNPAGCRIWSKHCGKGRPERLSSTGRTVHAESEAVKKDDGQVRFEEFPGLGKTLQRVIDHHKRPADGMPRNEPRNVHAGLDRSRLGDFQRSGVERRLGAWFRIVQSEANLCADDLRPCNGQGKWLRDQTSRMGIGRIGGHGERMRLMHIHLSRSGRMHEALGARYSLLAIAHILFLLSVFIETGYRHAVGTHQSEVARVIGQAEVRVREAGGR